MAKNLGPNSGRQNFFLKNLTSSVTRYLWLQLSLYTISEKTNDPLLREISDKRTDRQMDGKTDKSDLMGRCPTNVARPIYYFISNKLQHH